MLREIGCLGSWFEEELASLSCPDGRVERDSSASSGPESLGARTWWASLVLFPVPSMPPVLPARLGKPRNLDTIQPAGLPFFPLLIVPYQAGLALLWQSPQLSEKNCHVQIPCAEEKFVFFL